MIFSEIRNNWFIEQVENLEKKGFSRAEIARRLNVKPQYLTPFFNNSRHASEKFVKKFCEEFEINQNDLLNRMRVYENKQQTDTITREPSLDYGKNKQNGIPLIPVEAMAGYANGDVQVMDYELDDDLYIIPDFEDKGVKFLVRVSGSSMYPKYSNGDLLACRPIHDTSFFQWGKVYVLDTDQGPLVKRLFECKSDESCMECHSENKEHYPVFLIPKSSIRKVSIVVGVIRFE